VGVILAAGQSAIRDWKPAWRPTSVGSARGNTGGRGGYNCEKIMLPASDPGIEIFVRNKANRIGSTS